jgi:hypothetical protein
MSEQPANGSTTRSRSSRRRRRVALRALTSVIVLVLLGVLASIASGLIKDRAHPEIATIPTTPEPPKPVPNGWGPGSTYLGSYRLLGATLQRGSGSPMPLKDCAKGCGLSVFLLEPNKEALEEEGKEAPKIPSGLLKLLLPIPSGHGGVEPVLFYLSELSSSLYVATAKIRAANYTGPIIGYFAGRTMGPGRFSGTATIKEIGVVRARFVRVTTKTEEQVVPPEGVP